MASGLARSLGKEERGRPRTRLFVYSALRGVGRGGDPDATFGEVPENRKIEAWMATYPK